MAAQPSTQRPKSPKKTKQKMDSDDKTLITILAGLGAMVVVVVGLIAAYTVFVEGEKPKATASLAPAAPVTGSASQDGASAGVNQAVATARPSAIEGPRSTFNPDTAMEPGEVVLADPPQGFEDKIRPRGFTVTEHLSLGRLGLSVVRVRVPSGVAVADAIKILKRELPGVTVDANTHFDSSAGAGLDRESANPRAMIGWVELAPNCGVGLVLGQIDSGVDTEHPALKGQDITYRAFFKPGRQPGPADHGTSVAAMLVGKPDWGGLLPGAKLYAANMFEINEQGEKVGSAVGLLQAMDWLVGQNVSAINLSIAGDENEVVQKAFATVRRKNMVLVAAVGNWGRADKRAYPAAYENVIAVTATNGPELIYSHANSGDYVDFSAPGVGIYTAVPGGGGKPQSGTSFAAPYITVMAAILANAGKAPDTATLLKLLSPVTNDLGKPGKDDVFGFGLVKARPVCKT